jgi:hypothetical protein
MTLAFELIFLCSTAMASQSQNYFKQRRYYGTLLPMHLFYDSVARTSVSKLPAALDYKQDSSISFANEVLMYLSTNNQCHLFYNCTCRAAKGDNIVQYTKRKKKLPFYLRANI